MSVQPIKSYHEGAYKSLTKGLKELGFQGPSVPSELVLGDSAFPLAMNSQGQVLMAASMYCHGRIVVLGHESYLTAFPALVENALTWLRGDQSDNLSVGVHKNVKAVADNLSKTSFQAKVVGEFSGSQGVGVYVTDAYSIGADVKELVAFLKAGGGVLMAGQAWSWAEKNPKKNTLLLFEGNKVSGVTGIYFSEQKAEVEVVPVQPQIPSSLKTLRVGKTFDDDLEVLLQGVSEFDLTDGLRCSDILVHGPLAFPIGTTEEGMTFLAGSYYGKGRVILVSHEWTLKAEKLATFWKNAIGWLSQGHKGVVGVWPDKKLLSQTDIKHEETEFRKDLSVFVCTVHKKDQVQQMHDFVAEGGGLLIGGHVWHWSYSHHHPMSAFSGNKILNKMGLSLLPDHFQGKLYKVPALNQAEKDINHFRHLLRRFVAHVTQGEELTEHEEKQLTKLGTDCAYFLNMKTYDTYFYTLVQSNLTDMFKKSSFPQSMEENPVKSPKDKLLISVADALFKTSSDPDTLVPYIIKDIPIFKVVEVQKITIAANTTDKKEWISTGLYLSPGMKSTMTFPSKMVKKKDSWKVQIGCQSDHLAHEKWKRAPVVIESFPVTTEKMEVANLWGGLIYLVAPPKTKVKKAVVKVEKAVLAPHYKSGVTTADDWLKMRTSPVPWTEFEFDNIILTVPSHLIRELESLDEVAKMWDDIMEAVTDLAALPSKLPRKERIVADVQISAGWLHAGYPIMMHSSVASRLFKPEYARTEGLWGEIHELGHNQQRHYWEFKPHTTEATCNLWSVYVHEEVLGVKRAKANSGTASPWVRDLVEKYVEGGKDLNEWKVWLALETYLQLQKKFGWKAFKKVFAAYHKMEEYPTENNEKMNLYAETFSQVVGMNLTGFFKAWNWPIDAATEQKLSELPAWSNHPMAQYE